MTSNRRIIDLCLQSRLTVLLIIFLFSFKTDQVTFDETRPNHFRGYGNRTKMINHPCLYEEWSTTFRKTYLKPNNRTKPNAGQKLPVGDCEFDNTLREGYRKSQIASGF